MTKNSYFMVVLLLLCWAAEAINGQSESPAPAPAPEYVNLTDLLSVAGPFHTFLNYLETTKVIQVFQNAANNSDDGITIFVPRDSAFSTSVQHRLSNLTQDQLKSICLFHALNRYYPLSNFTDLSRQNPIPTLAGGGLNSINVTDHSGTISIDSGWTRTRVTSAVHAAVPVAIYQVDGVLLPEAIFGTDIPPTPAPAPAPVATALTPTPADLAPAADARRGGGGRGSGSSSYAAPRMILDLGLLASLLLCGPLLFQGF
ncbi:Fasciclin-like arabinogalactan protein 7 [Striga hermonthica]|uniref:Fasciclin-like arabinogalactan protein 7 n=1 Tax=Striga hermonthica TaxID=68872 RepID=A0A9N7RD82_STRHE|nr:Fasciclin-like arabinogalactan protein 7 [Striga hermonthica]